jgi:hypothetical protein
MPGSQISAQPRCWRLQGCSLERLAALEADLLAQYGAAGLAAASGAGHASLLALLAGDPLLAEQLAGGEPAQGPSAVAGAAGAGRPVSEQELLAAVRCCLQACQLHGAGGAAAPWEDAAALEAAAQALCAHYGVARVEQLGYGSLERLARSCLEAGEPGRAAVQPAVALACGHAQQQAAGCGCPAGTAVQLALAALEAAPELCGLGGWCGWQGFFQHACGPLPDFLHQHSAQLQAAGLSFLQLPGGEVVKVPAQASVEAFVQALGSARDAAGAAGQALGLVGAHGGVGAAPLGQLGQLVEGCLAAVVAEARRG